jgi:quinol-cytochrome oxidoreductase complex cytochrome b subunit
MAQTEYSPEESVPFFPDHVRTEIKVVIGITTIALIFGLIGMLSPLGLEEPADPMNTPMHVKPEWYFLALYQLLKFIPKTIGVMIPIVMLIVLTLWPFIDPKPEKDQKKMKIRFAVVTVGMLVLIALTIWGQVS